MDKRIGLFVGLTALFAMGSAGAQTCPTVPVAYGTNPETGHVFEIYAADRIDWPAAKACADSKLDPTESGLYGHLATLTSDSEDLWVDNLRKTSGLGEVWVGGSQPPSAGVGAGWTWENSEGDIATRQFPGPSYSNWLPLEPNDNNNSVESYLAIGLSSTDRGWNDEGFLPNITGFVVEYETPRTADQCTGSSASTEACPTINGQTLTFPAGTFEPGDAIQFTAYEFNDPRVVTNESDLLYGKCRNNPGPLTLFKESDGFGPGVELRIPPYLCGSPRFVVVKVNSEDLSITKGAVLVKNETTEKVLPGNLYKCFDPLTPPPPPPPPPLNFPDPQFQDVVVWQTTNPENMAENATVAPDLYVGAATEATNGCGSTTAKVRGASYFVVGMHIDFRNNASDLSSSQLQNYQQFRALTRYKLTLLRQSIRDARSEGSLRPVVSTAMEALIALAIYRLDQDNPAGALNQVGQFLRLVNAANYTQITNRNFNGDHLMRGENIAFTLRVKVIPFK